MEALPFSLLSWPKSLCGLATSADWPADPLWSMWSASLPCSSCSPSRSHLPCLTALPHLAPSCAALWPIPSALCSAPCITRSIDGIQSKGGNQAEDLYQENENMNSFWKPPIPLIPHAMEACRTFPMSAPSRAPIKWTMPATPDLFPHFGELAPRPLTAAPFHSAPASPAWSLRKRSHRRHHQEEYRSQRTTA
jgi:hypothetical protein